MDNQKETFVYTYSAKEPAEVDAIRKKYLPREEDKMEKLCRLDRSATKKAQAWSLTLGIIGALILGTDMSLAMTDLGASLETYWNRQSVVMSLGIAIGVVGLVLVALAYPVYNRILQKERNRIAPEILRLTDELMK